MGAGTCRLRPEGQQGSGGLPAAPQAPGWEPAPSTAGGGQGVVTLSLACVLLSSGQKVEHV